MKSSFAHLGVALIVGIAALVGYGTWYAAIAASSTAGAELQNQISAKTETASRITAARSAISEIVNDETTVRGYFVPEANVVAFIDDLEARGLSRGTTVDVLSVSTSGTGVRPTLELALTIEGSFDAVLRTVGIIEYAPYDLLISKFSLAQDSTDNWHADVTVVVGSVSESAKVRMP